MKKHLKYLLLNSFIGNKKRDGNIMLGKEELKIIYYCFHHPRAVLPEYRSTCICRKPEPGLLLKAGKDFGLDLEKCYMVGDGINDIKAGKAAGCKTILIGRSKCDMCKLMDIEGVEPDLILPDLLTAVKTIKAQGVKSARSARSIRGVKALRGVRGFKGSRGTRGTIPQILEI